MPVAAITRHDVQQWINILTRDNLSASTIGDIYRGVFKAVLNKAILDGRLAVSPCHRRCRRCRRDGRARRAEHADLEWQQQDRTRDAGRGGGHGDPEGREQGHRHGPSGPVHRATVTGPNRIPSRMPRKFAQVKRC